MEKEWENTVIVPITETAFNLFVNNTNRKTGETLCEALSCFIEDNIKIDGPHGQKATAQLPFELPNYEYARKFAESHKIESTVLNLWWCNPEKPTIDHRGKSIKTWKISLLVYDADKENERIEKIGEKIKQQEES
ncbi:MAG: hypothetical protein LBU89_00790 [Fibromonadaceae bacterium]|jgi:hypothetical protein|nr:hypothetical protein [Fibromonadaceae bacterium]